MDNQNAKLQNITHHDAWLRKQVDTLEWPSKEAQARHVFEVVPVAGGVEDFLHTLKDKEGALATSSSPELQPTGSRAGSSNLGAMLL